MNISTINNNYTGFVQGSVAKASASHLEPENDNAVQEDNQVDSNKKNHQVDTQNNAKANDVYGNELTQSEMQLLKALKQTDTKVRQHEMAHIAAGGRYITSGAHFSYQQGPDGKKYVVGGEVSIDTSPVPGDPQATIQKMRQIKNAALAPASPSSQDMKVASRAVQTATKATSELMMIEAERQAKSNKSKAFGNLQQASDSYKNTDNLLLNNTSSIHIAV